MRLGFLASSLDRELASTETSFETVALEVVSSSLNVDTVRSELRTLFTSVFAAPTSRSVFNTTQGNPTPCLWFRTRFDAPRQPWECLINIFFLFSATFGMRCHAQNPIVVS